MLSNAYEIFFILTLGAIISRVIFIDKKVEIESEEEFNEENAAILKVIKDVSLQNQIEAIIKVEKEVEVMTDNTFKKLDKERKDFWFIFKAKYFRDKDQKMAYNTEKKIFVIYKDKT